MGRVGAHSRSRTSRAAAAGMVDRSKLASKRPMEKAPLVDYKRKAHCSGSTERFHEKVNHLLWTLRSTSKVRSFRVFLGSTSQNAKMACTEKGKLKSSARKKKRVKSKKSSQRKEVSRKAKKKEKNKPLRWGSARHVENT